MTTVAQPFMNVALHNALESEEVEKLAAACNDVLTGTCIVEARHPSTTSSGRPELRFWAASLLACRTAFATLVEQGSIKASMAPEGMGEFSFADGVRVTEYAL